MKLPSVTHLQVLVLETLASTDQSGREIRACLARHRIRRSAPAFYQMMGRLEEAALVDGWYEQVAVAGQIVKERRYRLTRRGVRALADTRSFYGERTFMLAPAAKSPAHD